MQVIVHTLSRNNIKFELSKDVNLRELQQKTAKAMGFADIYRICIRGVRDQNDSLLINGIFHDDPADENLFEFMRKNQKSVVVETIKELHLFVLQNLGPGHFRPTLQNPDGMNARCGLISRPESRFFQSCAIPDLDKPYSSQIKNLGLIDEVPDSFLDPITLEIMDKPMVASDQRTYDAKTLVSMKFISPFTKEKLTRFNDNLSLRSKIENFITNHRPTNS